MTTTATAEQITKLNQSDVARICGISRERVSQLMNGINRGGRKTHRRREGSLSLTEVLKRYPTGRKWLGVENHGCS
jgi:hypothetical protein